MGSNMLKNKRILRKTFLLSLTFCVGFIVSANRNANAASEFDLYAAYCSGVVEPMVLKLTAIRIFPMPHDTVELILGLSERFTRLNDYLKARNYEFTTTEAQGVLQAIVQGNNDAKLCSADIAQCVSQCATNRCARLCFLPGPRSCQTTSKCWRDGPLPN